MEQYKYFAFISYNSHDLAWGRKLQNRLEGYRMPAALCSERGWERKPIKPVFFAPTDIQPGGLSEELRERLRASKNLIVICSPHSAKSEWVGKEIAYFHSLGRDKNIHFFIVDGIPNSGDAETECINPVVKTLGLPEILGANINEKNYRRPWLNRERAYIQLITKLLGVEFDSVWQRHRRIRRQQFALWIASIVMVIAAIIGVWINSRPVDVAVSLRETTAHIANLPPLKDAVVSISLENETKTDTFKSLDKNVIFANIPAYDLGREVRIRVECKDWLPVDTTLDLSKVVTINMARNPHSYGDVEFRLWSMKGECGVANVPVTIAGVNAVSDEKGYVKVFIPLEKQSSRYKVSSKLMLEDDILTMPVTKSRVLRVKDN